MIAFLISLAPFIPIILQVVGIIIKWFGTSEENLKAYADMVQKNKDAGLITVDAARKLQGYHDEMKKNKP